MRLSAAIRLATVALALTAAAAPALAEVAPPKLYGSYNGFFKQRKRVAVPAYHVTYVTQQQGTAVASIAARTRLNLVLQGVDEATMQKLADEAHADLVGQLKAAGFDVLPDAESRALAGAVEAVPGNKDIVEVGRSVTIGKSVKIGWTAVGATAAPLLKPWHNPASPTGAAGMAAMGATSKLGAAARTADAVALVPSMLVDFAEMEAKPGRDFLGRPAAGVSAALRFGLRGTSSVTAVSAYDKGAPFTGGLFLRDDFPLVGPFATLQEGGADVRVGSMTAMADQNYQVKDRARGDAVVVDLAVWEPLVRDAYKAFNAAIVAAAVKERG